MSDHSDIELESILDTSPRVGTSDAFSPRRVHPQSRVLQVDLQQLAGIIVDPHEPIRQRCNSIILLCVCFLLLIGAIITFLIWFEHNQS